MNLVDALVPIVIVAIIGVAAFFIIRNRKKNGGRGSCGSCAGCELAEYCKDKQSD